MTRISDTDLSAHRRPFRAGFSDDPVESTQPDEHDDFKSALDDTLIEQARSYNERNHEQESTN